MEKNILGMTMGLEKLTVLTTSISLVIGVLSSLLIYMFCIKAAQMKRERFGEQLFETLEDNFRSRTGIYERLEKWLKSIGAEYSMKGCSEPFRFMTVNIMLTVTVFLITGMWSGILAGMVMAVCVFILEILFLILLDRKQNKEMLDDIAYLYDAVQIQLGSSIYVVAAVSNALIYIKNRRLKKALEELCRSLALGGDVRSAARDFREKFNNAYLDAFCNVLVQTATETGESGKLIEDMARQLTALKATGFTTKKKEVENLLQLCIIAIFVVFTALIFYLCIAGMTGSVDILF